MTILYIASFDHGSGHRFPSTWSQVVGKTSPRDMDFKFPLYVAARPAELKCECLCQKCRLAV